MKIRITCDNCGAEKVVNIKEIDKLKEEISILKARLALSDTNRYMPKDNPLDDLFKTVWKT